MQTWPADGYHIMWSLLWCYCEIKLVAKNVPTFQPAPQSYFESGHSSKDSWAWHHCEGQINSVMRKAACLQLRPSNKNMSGSNPECPTVYECIIEAGARYTLYFHLFADADKKLRALYKGLRNTIPKDVFGAFKMAIPPQKEQDAIVCYIDEQVGKVDYAIGNKRSQIDKLKEYKTTLINSAVTGKIKVV